ncbi:hypothetical protein WN944_017390 [Citrus x changshan-huyou]|uniref:Yippee domain-containing protein n=1 Tax=Citrus x changshan-huyou TaxID=2935761 RepID=A0AAP0MG52_9ROSI
MQRDGIPGIANKTLILVPSFSVSRPVQEEYKIYLGGSGRAFLFSHAANIVEGPKEDRHLLTGLHTVADVYCADCGELLGWTYKIVLEKFKIAKDNW